MLNILLENDNVSTRVKMGIFKVLSVHWRTYNYICIVRIWDFLGFGWIQTASDIALYYFLFSFDFLLFAILFITFCLFLKTLSLHFVFISIRHSWCLSRWLLRSWASLPRTSPTFLNLSVLIRLLKLLVDHNICYLIVYIWRR
jgi:hypothetical protein